MDNSTGTLTTRGQCFAARLPREWVVEVQTQLGRLRHLRCGLMPVDFRFYEQKKICNICISYQMKVTNNWMNIQLGISEMSLDDIVINMIITM